MEDGAGLFFRKLGSGSEAIVILNGFYLTEDFKHFADKHTVIFLDLRNRGRSNYLTDSSKLERGIQQDVDDLEGVRRHFGLSQVALIGHSYAGMTVALYGMKYPDHVSRIIQIGPVQPDHARQYPPQLTNRDGVLQEFFGKVAKLQEESQTDAPEERCRKFVSLMRIIQVANPADAGKIHWDLCDFPTELNFMAYWLQHLQPSIQRVNLTAEDFGKVTAPVLTIHGTKDRSAPYGSGREWAMRLPKARLLAVDNTAHAPWIEAPEKVLPAMQTFLDGAWPETSATVDLLD